MHSTTAEAGKALAITILLIFSWVYLCGSSGIYQPNSYLSKNGTTRISSAVHTIQEWGQLDSPQRKISSRGSGESRPFYYVVSVIFMVVIFVSLLIWAMKGMT